MTSTQAKAMVLSSVEGRSPPFGIGYAGRQPLESGWYAIRWEIIGADTNHNRRADFQVR